MMTMDLQWVIKNWSARLYYGDNEGEFLMSTVVVDSSNELKVAHIEFTDKQLNDEQIQRIENNIPEFLGYMMKDHEDSIRYGMRSKLNEKFDLDSLKDKVDDTVAGMIRDTKDGHLMAQIFVGRFDYRNT